MDIALVDENDITAGVVGSIAVGLNLYVLIPILILYKHTDVLMSRSHNPAGPIPVRKSQVIGGAVLCLQRPRLQVLPDKQRPV